MKILLINPPFNRLKGIKDIFMPLGISYLGAFLREGGLDVSIYNAEFPKEYVEDVSNKEYSELMQRHVRYVEVLNDDDNVIWKEVQDVFMKIQPDIVGISAMSAKLPSVFKVIDIAKRLLSECKIVIGGPHATIMPNEILEKRGVDFVVRGEGERTFLELCEMISSKNHSFSKIDGISFKNNGETVHNKGRSLETDLSRFSFPAKDLFLDREKYPLSAFGNIVTSRGCPFNCTFCGAKNIWTRKVRKRDLDDVINEILFLRTRYEIPSLFFWDDSFTVDRERIIELCNKMIKNKIEIPWSCTTRADLLDEELLNVMKRARCFSIDIGLESASDRMLKNIKKNITMDQFYETSSLLRKCRMRFSVFLMIGFPEETESDILKTIEFAKKTNASYLGYSIFTPYPGTEAYQNAQKLGVIKGKMDWSKYSHQSPENYFCKNVAPERFFELSSELANIIDKHNDNQKKFFNKNLQRLTYYSKNPKVLMNKIISRCKSGL